MEQNKTFEEFANEEERIHKIFFLPWYQKKDIKVLEDNVGKNSVYDTKVIWNGKIITIDEKASERDYFCAELIQDIETGNLGHIYHPKDYYLYTIWGNRQTNEKPLAIYWVKAQNLLYFISQFSAQVYKNENGWGKTLFIPIAWERLLNDGYAFQDKIL